MLSDKYYSIAKNILFPICRSITGDGVRKTLQIIKKEFPLLKIHNVKSGTKVFDWIIPPEWNISDGYILDKNNKKILDFKNNNLHVVGYSTPVNKFLLKKNLLKNLHSLPKQQRAIPYVTSYYKKNWGFCISHLKKKKIIKDYKETDTFKVVIKSSFRPKGNLNYGELILKGKSKQEILVSTYICHPSMANNELSGPIVSMSLIKYFSKIKKLDKTLRFIFIPETIGSITYLHKNLTNLKKNIIGGYNLTCIGDERQHSCMFTKYKNTNSDKSLEAAYKKLKIKFRKYSFLKRGSDERQYNSPGIDLPIAGIFRTKFCEFPEYHTSLDDFTLVTKKGIRGGFIVAKTAIDILRKKIIPKNKILCEPQMGKRGLYHLRLSQKKINKDVINYMDFLQYSDGKNDLCDISKKLNLTLNEVTKILKILQRNRLIEY